MKLISLEYADARLDWKLAPVEFFNLTLLVGVSGVGKTRILRSVLALKRIAEGQSLPGVSWKLKFSATNGRTYSWSGEFENNTAAPDAAIEEEFGEFSDGSDENKGKPKILREELYDESELIVERDSGGIKLRGNLTPKLASHESILKTLKEEDSIDAASASFARILYSDQTSSVSTAGSLPWVEFGKVSRKHGTFESIREAALPIQVKLALASAHAPEHFARVKDRFMSIFPYVESLEMRTLETTGVPSFFRELPVLHLKERGVVKWIPQHNISSGMMRTFLHIGELFFSPEGTVILIDEFENSLGVNCIDIVTEDLVNESRTIQFIVTSHHPYVINNIGVEHWKIVSRSGNEVTTKNATDYRIDRSRHDAFMQLINLGDYRDGIGEP